MNSLSPRQSVWGARCSSARPALRVGGFLLLGLALGCGDDENQPTREVAAVKIDSAPLVGNRIGQRWALTATALDTFGEPIPGVDFDWDSTEHTVAKVDADGLVTAMRMGVAQISATAAGYSSSIELSSVSAVPSDVGEMYTTWFARSDEAPVAIVDGRLEVFAIYPGAAQPTRPWPHPGVARFQWAGDRLALLTDVVDGLGTLHVLDRHEEWTVLRVADAMGFQLSGNWIVELGAGGSLRVKEGVHGQWTTLVSSGVEQYELNGNRIAVLQDDGELRVKDSIDAGWTVLATTGVRAFELHGDRIAILSDDLVGELRVKDGIEGPWTTIDAYVKKVALSGNRIGVVRTDGVARVKDGIDGEWTLLASSYVDDLQLAGDRISVLFEGGDLRAKDGFADPWTVLSTSARRYVLQGDYIGMLSRDDELMFRIGLDGPWSKVDTTGTVTQFLPVADVPVPPARTTAAEHEGPRSPCAGIAGDGWNCPNSYAEAQQACADDGARCESVSDLSSPVPHYGRFCGVDRPLAPDWNWALGPSGGPMDAFDALCMHQDNAPSWYPAAEVGSSDACIVRYGLTYARLTRDGTVIGPGSVAYDEMMNQMPHLRDAIANDDWYTAGSTPEQLDDFIVATRAKH